MKTMKRFASVLLAAVLALAMLTACGGGGSSSNTIGKQFEDKYIGAINSIRTKDKLTNDSTLRSAAYAMLETIDKDGKVVGKNAYNVVYGGDTTAVTMTVYSVAVEEEYEPSNLNKVYTAKELTAENISSLVDVGSDDDDKKMADSVDAIGVASIERNGKTYVAVAIQMSQTLS